MIEREGDEHQPPEDQPAAGNVRRYIAELGQKGLRTRRKLMDSAAKLLEDLSPVALTPTAIARGAGTSSATFYVYFDDVTDIVGALAQEANDDLGEIFEALEQWRACDDPHQGASRFIDAFRDHWDKYRTILSVRNMEADCGKEPFRRMRRAAGLRIIEPLAEIMSAGPVGAEDGGGSGRALAKATVIFAAIERLAAAANIYPEEESGAPLPSDLRAAQISLLCEMMAMRRDRPAAE